MALQDKFDSAFTDKLLKKALMSPVKTPTTTANDNNYELTKSNLVTLSNSFTSLQNAFNKIYAHTLNVRNLHQYDEKRMGNISRQNKLETKISPGSSTPISTASGSGDSLASTAATLDNLSTSVEKLNEKMKKINLNGNGYSNAMLLGDGIGSNSRSRLGRLGRLGGRALGVAGVGLDAYGRYQEGQTAGQIAAGTGGGLAGAALGAKGGAAAGAAIGAFFFGAGAVPGAAIGGFLGGVGGYFAGSAAGDTAYDALNTRATGGGVKAGGTYVIGERGPEVLMLGGLSGKVIANGQRGKQSEAEKNLNTAADKSSRAAAKVIKGQPPGPTSYSSKFSNYLGSLFGNMPNWLNRIKDFLGIGDSGPAGLDRNGALGSGQYAAVGDLSGVSGNWKNDTDFLTAIDGVARKYSIDANDLIGLMYHESAGTMSPSVRGKNGATGLFQFMPAFFDTDTVAQMSRAQQVRHADEKIFAANRLPRGANAGQIYAAVFLPGVAQNQNYQGVLSRRGDRYYSSNPSLDNNNDGQIDYTDLARVISGHRVSLGLGQSPSLSSGGMAAPITGATRTGGTGVLTSGMKWRSYGFHPGADVGVAGNAPGTPIYAIDGGRIVYAGEGQPGTGFGNYGNVVAITHTSGQLAGLTTVYAHLENINRNVKVGSDVGGGALIGGMGNSGYSTGTHLHFEIRRQWNRRPQSPEEAENAVALYNANKWIVGGTATPEPATTRRISEEEATNAAIRSLLGLGRAPSYQPQSYLQELTGHPQNQASVNGTGGNGFRNYWNVTF